MTIQQPDTAPASRSGQGNGPQTSSTPGEQDSDAGFGAMSRDAAEKVKNATQEQADRLRERAGSAREHAADRIRRVGAVLRSAGEQLPEEDHVIAGYADQASARIEGIAEYLASTDVRTLVHDAQEFAKQKPAWFFGGAFVLGLAAGRFLKSSNEASTEDADRGDFSGGAPLDIGGSPPDADLEDFRPTAPSQSRASASRAASGARPKPPSERTRSGQTQRGRGGRI